MTTKIAPGGSLDVEVANGIVFLVAEHHKMNTTLRYALPPDFADYIATALRRASRKAEEQKKALAN
jgi:hypothetical protein